MMPILRYKPYFAFSFAKSKSERSPYLTGGFSGILLEVPRTAASERTALTYWLCGSPLLLLFAQFRERGTTGVSDIGHRNGFQRLEAASDTRIKHTSQIIGDHISCPLQNIFAYRIKIIHLWPPGQVSDRWFWFVSYPHVGQLHESPP
jgi:hypothetical protein